MTDEMKVIDANRYIVVGTKGPTGNFEFISAFNNEGDAKKLAGEMATATEGSVYSVYQFIGSAILEPKVTWQGASR